MPMSTRSTRNRSTKKEYYNASRIKKWEDLKKPLSPLTIGQAKGPGRLIQHEELKAVWMARLQMLYKMIDMVVCLGLELRTLEGAMRSDIETAYGPIQVQQDKGARKK